MTLDMNMVGKAVQDALAEDLGSGDVTTRETVSLGSLAEAQIVARDSGLIAGIPVAEKVFRSLSGEVRIEVDLADGQQVEVEDVILRLIGPAQAILSGERVALNFLGRLSGIATLTSVYVKAVEGTGAKILDTRKTTPGMRFLEKYAVVVGGGHNHRLGLFDMVLIKENHIRAAGGIPQAVGQVRAANLALTIEVETESLEQVRQALEAGVDRIMLDNMNPDQMKEAVKLVKARSGSGQGPELEASGNIGLHNVRQVAMTGVDFISVGALTHSAPALDLSLMVEKLRPR
jgi:nicotinate-nucleotide pyrophosphorylase (carboxylating)